MSDLARLPQLIEALVTDTVTLDSAALRDPGRLHGRRRIGDGRRTALGRPVRRPLEGGCGIPRLGLPPGDQSGQLRQRTAGREPHRPVDRTRQSPQSFRAHRDRDGSRAPIGDTAQRCDDRSRPLQGLQRPLRPRGGRHGPAVDCGRAGLEHPGTGHGRALRRRGVLPRHARDRPRRRAPPPRQAPHRRARCDLRLRQ